MRTVYWEQTMKMSIAWAREPYQCWWVVSGWLVILHGRWFASHVRLSAKLFMLLTTRNCIRAKCVTHIRSKTQNPASWKYSTPTGCIKSKLSRAHAKCNQMRRWANIRFVAIRSDQCCYADRLVFVGDARFIPLDIHVKLCWIPIFAICWQRLIVCCAHNIIYSVFYHVK